MIPNNNICLTEVERRLSMDEIKDCIIVGNTPDLQLLPCFKLEKVYQPTDKELRLLKDILIQQHPKYKQYPNLLANDIHHEFFFRVPIKRILNIKSFKQVLFKTVITKVKPIPNSSKYEVLTKKIRKHKK